VIKISFFDPQSSLGTFELGGSSGVKLSCLAFNKEEEEELQRKYRKAILIVG
jgi:hypothetical protein